MSTIDKRRLTMDERFKIKDLGKLKYFLSIKVTWLKERIHMCQHKYLLGLLNDTGILRVRTSKLPLG